MRIPNLACLLTLLCFSCGEPEVEVSEASGSAGSDPGADGSMQEASGATEVVERIEKDGGLVVEILEHGTGVVLRRDHDIRVHYRGYLAETMAEFDSSYSRFQPLTFTLGRGQVITGWDKGFLGLKVGTKAKIHVPAALGYGKRGSPPAIPRNSDLIFEVHVLEAR